MSRQRGAVAGALVLLLVAGLQGGVAGMSILSCLSILKAGQYLENGDYWLVMQTDCNLVLYKGQLNLGKKLWESGTTYGGRDCKATLAGTSQLQVLNSSDSVLASLGGNSVNGNYLQLDSSGGIRIGVLGGATLWNLQYPPLNDSAPEVAWGGDPTPEWRAMNGVLYMVAGYVLRPGTALQNGDYGLQLASGCNLQLRRGGAIKWAVGHGDSGSDCRLVLQDTGILQILLQNGTVAWCSDPPAGKLSGDSYVLYLGGGGQLAVFDNLQLKTMVWEADWFGKESNLRSLLAMLAGVLVVALVSTMLFWLVALYHGYCSGCVEPSTKDFEQAPESSGGKCRAFSLAEMRQATCRFKDKLGEGGFGQVFYGELRNGQKVAIKNLSAASKQGQKEFLTEIHLLSVVHHKYLVSLVGYCTFVFPFLGWKKQLLVYEYMSGGDLHKRLHGAEASSVPLTWSERTSIILQVAEGIEYLHHYCKPAIIHRDIKGSNVLLNETMTAKVADFGLSKLVAVEQDATHISTAVKGTFGYMDPEYFNSNRLTEKSDVYAFGVLLMEILTGRSSRTTPGEIETILVYRVMDAWRSGFIDQLADPNLGGVYNSRLFSELVHLSLLCVKERSIDRPSMIEVVQKLRKIGLIQLGPLNSLAKPVDDSFEVSVEAAGSDVLPPSMSGLYDCDSICHTV